MSEPTRRKRFRWTKVLYAAVGVYLLLTAVAWVWWNHHASATLAKLAAEIRARGEPLAWSEMAPEPLPPEQDAAVLYRRAEDATGLIAPIDPDSSFARRKTLPPRLERLSSMVGCLVSHPKFRAEHGREVRAILAEAKDALALCRRARGLRAADWGIDYDKPALADAFPDPPEIGVLARLACLAAVVAHEKGRDGEAVACLRDALALADSLETYPSILGSVMQTNAQGAVVNVLEEILPGLRVGLGPGAAEPTAARALLTELRDERPLCNGYRWTWMGERSISYDTFARIRRLDPALIEAVQSTEARWLWAVLDPMRALDQAWSLRLLDTAVQATAYRSYPSQIRSSEAARLDRMDRQLRAPGPIRAFTHELSGIVTPGARRIGLGHFPALAKRRMAATALAIRLCELDHGRRPEALAALVPDYLPAVPDDPFAEKGTKLLYRPDREPPVLYTRGTNCRDDGGQWRSEWAVWDDGGDYPFHLDGARARGACFWKDPTKPIRVERRRRRRGDDDPPEQDTAEPGRRHDIGGD